MNQRPPVIHRNPEILGSTPAFVGTWVPFRNLIDYLQRGATASMNSSTSSPPFRRSKQSPFSRQLTRL